MTVNMIEIAFAKDVRQFLKRTNTRMPGLGVMLMIVGAGTITGVLVSKESPQHVKGLFALSANNIHTPNHIFLSIFVLLTLPIILFVLIAYSSLSHLLYIPIPAPILAPLLSCQKRL